MSHPFSGAGITPEQGPPLTAVAGFFALGPLAPALAGAWLMWTGAPALATPLTPLSIGLTHLGTLGLLATVMMGALYQMSPTVAGTPIHPIRLAYAVQALWPLGWLCVVGGVVLAQPWLLVGGATLLAVATALFAIPVLWALSRSEVGIPTVRGLQLAVLALVGVVLLGLLFAAFRAGYGLALPGDYLSRRLAHLLLGLLVWVGGLISAVSWQVLPMFYQTPELPLAHQRAMVAGIALSLIALPLAGFAGSPGMVALAALPAAAAVLVANPVLSLRALVARKRRRTDYSVQAWMAGLSCALLAAALAPATWWLNSPAADVLFTWLLVWGFGGVVVHGMLSRIVPFLVWFHRLAPLLGKVTVPPVRKLYPQDWLRRSLLLHGASLLLGALAILTGWDPAARLTGLLLVLTAVAWDGAVVRVLATRAPEPTVAL